MNLVLIASAVLFLSSFTNATPTHIIKFKEPMDLLNAHTLLTSSHHAYLQSTDPIFIKKRNIMADVQNNSTQWQLEPIKIGNNLMAMTGVFTDIRFLDYISGKDGIVDYIEPNQYYQADMVLPSRHHRTPMTPTSDIDMLPQLQFTQASNWGLARISHRTNTDLSTYSYHESDGQGVDVYVLDSGVNVDHSDFGGRASHDISFVSEESEDDLGGHGTHVAGKIGGKTYGVAKGVRIHAVKILDKKGMGSTSSLIQAISHVIDTARPGKSLINLSLSGPKSKILNEVLKEATEGHNIPIFVSAGNSGSDACYFSPSSSKHVFTVGATDIEDKVPSYSDVGKCVSMYAPGSNIRSTWIGSTDATQSLDGTSMANPHVAGIAAILMSQYSYNSVNELYNTLRLMATRDVLSFDSKKLSELNSNNILAFYSAETQKI